MGRCRSELSGRQDQHINPILRVSSLADSIDFYTRHLGMELHHTFGEPAEFAIVGRDGHRSISQRAQGQAGTWLAVFVADPLTLREHLVAGGDRVLEQDEASAGEYRVEDPDGHVLRLLG